MNDVAVYLLSFIGLMVFVIMLHQFGIIRLLLGGRKDKETFDISEETRVYLKTPTGRAMLRNDGIGKDFVTLEGEDLPRFGYIMWVNMVPEDAASFFESTKVVLSSRGFDDREYPDFFTPQMQQLIRDRQQLTHEVARKEAEIHALNQDLAAKPAVEKVDELIDKMGDLSKRMQALGLAGVNAKYRKQLETPYEEAKK